MPSLSTTVYTESIVFDDYSGILCVYSDFIVYINFVKLKCIVRIL